MADSTIKKASDVKVDDKILSEDGEPLSVVETYEGESPMYQIELVQIHEGVSVDPEHEVVVEHIKCNASFILPLSRSDARASHIEYQAWFL